MATLEMVQLRSSLPTGRLTLRFATPSVSPRAPLDSLGDEFEALLEQTSRGSETITTPQVATVGSPTGVGETAARKGGDAR
jgi:hypothetical protein